MNAPRVDAFNCPKCGGPVVLRAPEVSQVAVCGACGATLDVSDVNVKILQAYAGAVRGKPLIPLGSKGKLFDDVFEVIGYLVRKVNQDGDIYRWREYLLRHPEKGFRWVTEYDGHWNEAHMVENVPPSGFPGQDILFRDLPFKHFQASKPVVDYVLGEFYWKVQEGESVALNDYISPPYMLSSEKGKREITWTIGRYIEPSDLWNAFSLPGEPPPRYGVFANQPNPYAPSARSRRLTAVVLCGLAIVVFALGAFFARSKTVLNQSFSFNSSEGEPSRVSDFFTLDGHTSNLEVNTWANVDNSWIYLGMALINGDTGQALDFGREISYYHGRDSDGPWSEGGQTDQVFLPEVPPGRYYLRLEPEKDGAGRYPVSNFNYTVALRQDVPRASFLFLALFLIALPWGIVEYFHFAFERDRWAESDHPWAANNDD